MRCPARALAALALLAVLVVLSAASPALAAGRRPQVTGVGVEEKGEVTRVVVDVTAKPKLTARMEREGKRLVVDLANCGVKGKPRPVMGRTGVVGGVMTQEFRQDQGRTTRVLVTLLERSEFSVRATDDQVVISLRPGDAGVFDESRPLVEPASKPQAEPVAHVEAVRFEHQAKFDAVHVTLPTSVEPHVSSLRPGTSRLVLARAELPEELIRTLDVTAYGGPIQSVSSFPTPSRAGSITIDVEHAPGAQGRLERAGTSLVWKFVDVGGESWADTGVASDGGAARRTRTVHVEDALQLPEISSGYSFRTDVDESAPTPDDASAVTPAVLAQHLPQGQYTGRRIDLDLKDADIHNVLRLLADVGRVNIITADDVQGSVTIRMRNVPWDQALDVVLQSKALGKVRAGNMIRVAPLQTLEKERELELARRKQEMRLAPLETRLVPVSYASATDLQPRARDLLSSRGSIAVDERTNVLVVRDVEGNLDQIEELIRVLDTQTPQVLVEARIVEATSRYLRDVGIQWGGDIAFSAATGNPTGLAFPHSVGAAGGASDDNTPTAGLSPFQNDVPNPNFAVNLPATAGTGQGGAVGLTMGSVDNTVNVNLRLSAAEATGMLRILSSPRILTLDNEDARIAQGTLIPFSQISAQGVQTVFQEAKLQLLVRPHVTADGSVSLKVKVNRDEPDFNQTSARGDPTILKREAETTLLVADGHTAVIGGIFTRSTGRNLDQVPFFGDIPVVGLLFQRRRASDQRSELVIFITPRVVNRAEALGR